MLSLISVKISDKVKVTYSIMIKCDYFPLLSYRFMTMEIKLFNLKFLQNRCIMLS